MREILTFPLFALAALFVIFLNKENGEGVESILSFTLAALFVIFLNKECGEGDEGSSLTFPPLCDFLKQRARENEPLVVSVLCSRTG